MSKSYKQTMQKIKNVLSFSILLILHYLFYIATYLFYSAFVYFSNSMITMLFEKLIIFRWSSQFQSFLTKVNFIFQNIVRKQNADCLLKYHQWLRIPRYEPNDNKHSFIPDNSDIKYIYICGTPIGTTTRPSNLFSH